MAYTYKGTKITGTSTTAKVFKSSGVTNAKKNQTYFNTSTGHVYTCTTAGNASKAKWKYVRTDVYNKPNVAPYSLTAPVGGSDGARTMKAEWKTPGSWSTKTNGRRPTELQITWSLGIPGTDPKKVLKTKAITTTSSSINLNNFVAGKTTYTRKSFWPFTNKTLSYVTINVAGKNSKGVGTAATATRKFAVPRKPEISGFSFNTETGVLSCTITTNAGTDYYERYDTRYKMVIKSTRSNSQWTQQDSSSTSTSFTISWDAGNYQSLSFGDYYEVIVTAWSRGYAGNSEVVTRKYVLSYPNAAQITSANVSAKNSTGKVTAYIKTNSSYTHPVDEVKLEKLANVEYATANAIPADASWEETGAVDNGNCTALTCSVSDLMPEAGKYTWLRVKSWHANEAVLKRYSAYYRVKGLENPAPTAADERISILSVAPGTDGKSAVVQLGWNQNGKDDATGTELAWSDEEDTWKSTESPKSYTFDWSDGKITYNKVTYQSSAKITIKGLSEGEKYYIRARRYLEGDTTSYSPYSNTATVITSDKPDSITAVCDRYVATGSSLDVHWVFSSTALQTKWQIVTTSGTVIANGEGSLGSTQISAARLMEFAKNNSITFTVQASTGSGFVISEEHTVGIISAPVLSIAAATPLTAQPFAFTATASELCDLVVICTSQGAQGQFPQGVLRQTDGDTIHSNVYTPIWWPTDATMALTKDTALVAGKSYYVIDSGGVYHIGGEVYSVVTSPSAESLGEYYEMSSQDGDTHSTYIEFPTGLNFWDLGRYTLSVVAIDRATGLQSEQQTYSFAVAWTHQAPDLNSVDSYSVTSDTSVIEDKAYYVLNGENYELAITEGDENPSAEGWHEVTRTDYITLTPIDETDANGTHHQAVQIALTPPPGSVDSDVYDIYRFTGDGARLIGQSFPLTYTATDEYAPFGQDMTHHYRIAIRTVDGDVAFNDFEYDLESEILRFDWGTGSLELPYNIQVGDSYSKDVEFRSHMDGGIDGYWNQNIERKGKLNSDVIRLIQQEDIDLARQLARYAGPVFVRTPDGSAYEADVQVTDLSVKNPAIHAIAFDATEVDLTQEFMLPTPYQLEEEEE